MTRSFIAMFWLKEHWHISSVSLPSLHVIIYVKHGHTRIKHFRFHFSQCAKVSQSVSWCIHTSKWLTERSKNVDGLVIGWRWSEIRWRETEWFLWNNAAIDRVSSLLYNIQNHSPPKYRQCTYRFMKLNKQEILRHCNLP